MASCVSLKGMAFYSHHGYYTHERTRGNNYIIDVDIIYDIERAADTDDLENAINYEKVYEICRVEMDNPRHLIESVARDLCAKLKHEFPTAERVTVTLEKLKPELGGPVAKAVVEHTC